jgi:hypothetical protein
MKCPYCDNTGRRFCKNMLCTDGKVRRITARCSCEYGTASTPDTQKQHLMREIILWREFLQSSVPTLPTEQQNRLKEAQRLVDTYCTHNLKRIRTWQKT